MRILVDEGVPVQIRRGLASHTVTTVQEMEWGGFSNGDLLTWAEGKFDLFITADQNLKYQQNLSGRSIAIVELSTNKRRRIEKHLVLIERSVNQLNAGDFLELKIPD